MKKFFVVCLLSLGLILTAQTMLLPVPYHSQGSPWFPADPGYPPYPPKNNWCTVACLHMLFDYYDHMGNNTTPLPALQIASVCNTDDVGGGGAYPGTFQSDARRAAHFSGMSVSLDGSVVGGYSWRKIGYSAIYGDTTTVIGTLFLNPNAAAKGMVGWMEVLNEGYPVIFNGRFPWMIGPPEGAQDTTTPNYTELGHSILLVGYNLNNIDPMQSLLYFHDPWYGPYVYYTVAQLIAGWPEGDYIFASPWEVKINAPDTVAKDSLFDVAASVRYTAPTVEYVQPNGPAFPQQFPVLDYAVAVLETDSCSLPLNINNPVDTLYLVDVTQSSYACYWTVSSPASGTRGSFRVKATGLLALTGSLSYPMYQDTIGGVVNGGCTYSTEGGSGRGIWESSNYGARLFPNPFINANSVVLNLSKPSKVEIKVFDELGREVKVLLNEELGTGQQIIRWDGKNEQGKAVPAGKYFYQIFVDGKKLQGEKAIRLK
jgi:hypothetical protein